MEITQEVNSETADLKTYFVEKCEQAGLTPEQTAQVVEFGTDHFYGGEREAAVLIHYFTWWNDRDLGAWLEKQRANEPGCYIFNHQDCGDPLCTVHGDVRDHSAVRP